MESEPSGNSQILACGYSDPALWPSVLSDEHRKIFVEKDPCRIENYKYPTDENGRQFVKRHYDRYLANGETINRMWFVYSPSTDSVFCFCCKLFQPNKKKTLITEGLCDWKNIGSCLNEHEVSKKHLECMQNWRCLELRLSSHTTIDEANERQIRNEKERWRSVFHWLFAIVQYLAENNLAFRGSIDQLHQPHNGNLLGMVELITKFDSVMKEHLSRIQCEDIHDLYLGKTIQNELIKIMGSKVRETIIARVNKAKYYAIILDCTPDVSHQEQFSLTIRFVKMNSFPEVPVTIQEHFITFLPVEETTGKELTAVLLKELNDLGLQIKNIRGQGYDNGANMKGHKSGLQSRILEHNPRAFFTPCACHSLNLLLGDIAKSCVKGTSFFGVLARLYVFLSGSTKRWSIFKRHVNGLTVKLLCETRWESRSESVVIIHYQAAEIHSALNDMADNLNDPGACSEVESLADAILEFSFLVSVVFCMTYYIK